MNKIVRGNRLFLFLILILLLIVFAQVLTFIKAEQHIYFWDSKGYWMTWQNLSSQLLTSPISEWFTAIYSSINNDDYNVLPNVLLTPFYYLPIENRLAFILGISLCYFIPTVLLLVAVFKHIEGFQSYLWLICITILAATYCPFWVPVLKGLPDIVGLIPILGVVLFVLL